MSKDFKVFFGEMHDNTHQAYDPDFNMDQILERAKSHLDFYAAAYYPSTSPAFSEGGHPSDANESLPLNIEVWKNREQINREWKESCDAIARFNENGRFITFPGFEWQGNAQGGDHNVFFLADHPHFIYCDNLIELYGALEQTEALAIPHHTAYLPGFRGKDWDLVHPQISPFSEIYSVHGSSEGDAWGSGLQENAFLAPDISAGSYSAALKRGLILGAIASTDNWGKFPGHYGRGLAAVLSNSLSRDDLWKAFKERRVYALTGDRIRLDFTINGQPMGSWVEQADHADIRISVEGEDSLEYVELVKNEESLRVFTRSEEHIQPDDEGFYKLRFEYGWGPSASYAKMDDKQWVGTISVTDGSIKSVTPCLVDGKHDYSHDGNVFRFCSHVGQEEADYVHHNSFVLKFKLNENSRVRFDVNGHSYELGKEELLEESRAHFYTDESKKLLQERFDVNTEELYRDDVIYGMSYKFKIHRLVPEHRYCRHISCSDKTGGPAFYRVRVRQRNGQMAFSSPIWLK